MRDEIRKIIENAKAQGRYEQMLSAAHEYAKVPPEERLESCYLIRGVQHEILRGVIELEGIESYDVSESKC